MEDIQKPKRKYTKRTKPEPPPPPPPLPCVIEASLEPMEPDAPAAELPPDVEVIQASSDGVEILEAPRVEYSTPEYGNDAPTDSAPPPAYAAAYSPTSAYAPPEMAYVPQYEPDAKRREIITKLTRYRESFAAFKTLIIDRNASTEALQSQLDEVRAVVSCRNLSAMVKAGYLVSTKGLEVVMSKGGAKVYGLSDLLSKSPEIDAILTEIAIETAPVQGLSPIHRLAFCTLASAIALDSHNRQAEKQQSRAGSAPSDDLRAAAKSL